MGDAELEVEPDGQDIQFGPGDDNPDLHGDGGAGDGLPDVPGPRGDLPDPEVDPAGGDDIHHDSEHGLGIRVPRVQKSPECPTKKEIEEHMVTHIPYRNWCPHCVKGIGVDSPHFQNREPCLSLIHI